MADTPSQPAHPQAPFGHTGTSGSEELAHLALAQSILNGSANDAEVSEAAMKLISGVMQSFVNCAESIDQECNREQRNLLDKAEAMRNAARQCVAVFAPHYPHHATKIEHALHVTHYALATIIPVIVMGAQSGNADTEQTYIVKNSSNGLIKIGKSIDPAGRINALENGTGCGLTVCAIIPRNIERELHQRFAHLRVFREWFKDDGSIAAFIASEAHLANQGGQNV